MTEIFLMETLAAFVEEHTKDIILEVETEPDADRKERPAEVHKYGLPKKDDKIKRIPYVLLQLLKGEDEAEDSECMIRIIAATYSEDWDADALAVSEQLKILCVKLNISVSELARLCNTSPQAFSQKMKREGFTPADLKKVAEAAGCKYEGSFILPDGGRVTD